ncbi:hypothetical protein RvY_07930 [Ramazzottius varieornatus]|uniref:Uncharacterized protein n=1 Tax=Ramazzottius varieornatus TaxID=947166 RepID=A0A1D1V6S8_RAMVA|nr:hypothetical protein RvY_07930 [Ramazzottius varieornatus]
MPMKTVYQQVPIPKTSMRPVCPQTHRKDRIALSVMTSIFDKVKKVGEREEYGDVQMKMS